MSGEISRDRARGKRVVIRNAYYGEERYGAQDSFYPGAKAVLLAAKRSETKRAVWVLGVVHCLFCWWLCL